METMYKKLGKNRGFTIPRRYCEQLGITGGSGIAVTLEGKSVIISPSADTCILCGNMEGLTKHGAHHICSECVQKIAQGA